MQSTRLQYKLKSISSKNTIHTTKAKHFVTAWYEKPKNYCENGDVATLVLPVLKKTNMRYSIWN